MEELRNDTKLHELIERSLEFNIEYQGYLSNHIVHALVALRSLGAGDSRLEEYYNFYIKRLEPAEPAADRINADNWKEYLGQNRYFLDYVEFFKKQLEQSSPQKVLLTFLPDLAEGVGSAAFHTVIQLGYGLASGSTTGIAMGLAYFCYEYYHFGNLPPYDAAAPSSHDNAVDSFFGTLELLRQEERLSDPKIAAKRKEGFQLCLKLLATDYHDVLMSTYKRWHVDLGDKPRDKLFELLWSLTTDILRLYDQMGNKYFFVLHGVTSIYSLKQVLLHLSKNLDGTPETDKKVFDLQLALFRNFWWMVLYLYVAEGRPSLSPEDRVDKERRREYEQEESHTSWEALVPKVVQHQDEHVIKLVQVCKEEFDALSGDEGKRRRR